jgi:hypothetical protein
MHQSKQRIMTNKKLKRLLCTIKILKTIRDISFAQNVFNMEPPQNVVLRHNGNHRAVSTCRNGSIRLESTLKKCTARFILRVPAIRHLQACGDGDRSATALHVRGS